jgi:hypothetical protein
MIAFGDLSSQSIFFRDTYILGCVDEEEDRMTEEKEKK